MRTDDRWLPLSALVIALGAVALPLFAACTSTKGLTPAEAAQAHFDDACHFLNGATATAQVIRWKLDQEGQLAVDAAHDTVRVLCSRPVPSNSREVTQAVWDVAGGVLEVVYKAQ